MRDRFDPILPAGDPHPVPALRRLILVGAFALLAPLLPAQDLDCPSATCAVVRQDGATTGSSIGVYETIQAAINDAAIRGHTEIVVYPGRYYENLHFSLGGMTLRSLEGPLLTCIDGSTSAISDAPTIGMDSVQGLSFIGFTISGGGYGVLVSISAEATIRNCVIEGNRIAGVGTFWNEELLPPPAVSVINCVVSNNSGSGIAMTSLLNSRGCPLVSHMSVHNSIITNNGRYAVDYGVVNSICCCSSFLFTDRFQFSHNLLSANAEGNLGPSIANGSIPIGTANIQNQSPGFIGSATGCGPDVRLLSTSNARNQGWPAAAYRDPDGSRNDMGAFGGPFAEAYYTSMDDGPVIKQVTPLGTIRAGDGPFTIEAVGAAR
ncbi:MAG: right-handed parallel beta-helix repeat-containing protein [Sumerlaeia bacterium]